MRIPASILEQIDGSAKKGAERLDRRRPNWFNDINVGRLDMGHECLCVCGQLYGEYGEESVATIIGGWIKKLTGARRDFDDVAARYGFSLPASAAMWADAGYYTNTQRYQAVWHRLERAWKNEIKARRGAVEAA